MTNVLVAGDVAIDWLEEVVPPAEIAGDPEQIPNHRLVKGFRWTPLLGGALLLERLVEAALAAREVRAELLRQQPLDPWGSEVRKYLNSLAFVAPEDGAGGSAIRVRAFKGFSIPAGGKGVAVLPLAHPTATPDVLILDDAANGCRWDAGFAATIKKLAGQAKLVVLKLNRPLEKSPFLELSSRVAGRMLVVVNASDLRHQGVDVSHRLSWERTALDVLRASITTELFPRLLRLGQVIVRFDCDGCVAVAQGEQANLVFDPDGMEGEFASRISGTMPGTTSAFVAALTAHLIAAPPNPGERNPVAAIPAALTAARRMLQRGFVTVADGRPEYPTDLFLGSAYHFRICHLPPSPLPTFSILTETLNNHPRLPMRIVREGIETALAGIPLARYGDLLLADRREIEGFRAVENALREYVTSEGGKPRTMSVGVFGPPGAGKSLGIKSLAKAIGGRITAQVANLSQFTSVTDLAVAFHHARDISLGGNLPLLIFDEFDSAADGQPFGWLKHFLAPMQDGIFSDHGRIHPIGRAILVFCGGVTQRFSVLQALANGEETKETDQVGISPAEFKKVKGPDFVSRMRNHLDVVGVDPPANDPTSDPAHTARRALVLRAQLMMQFHRTVGMFAREHGQNLFQVDEVVLNAFLSTKRYKHGARSMEALLDMSELTGRERFTVTALPPDEQLLPHVDDSFCKLLRQGG